MAKDKTYRKIPIDDIIKTLMELKKQNLLYVDVSGRNDNAQDILFFSIRDGYDKEHVDEKIVKRDEELTDDFLTNLI